jgi:hypothetical protein
MGDSNIEDKDGFFWISAFAFMLLVGSIAVSCAKAAEPKWEQPMAKLTVRVVDEQGQPVPAATIRIGFTEASSPREVYSKGTTDSHGEFTAEGHSDMRLSADASKTGYYDSGCPEVNFTTFTDGKWQPWENTVTNILRPIVRPVALYAKSAWIEIPTIGETCGYDLEKGDWVAPYGKGIMSDFGFKLERRYVSRQDFYVNVQLSFARALDGIQEVQWPAVGRNSVFKWPREAPETGYDSTLKTTLTSDSHGYHPSASAEQGYFFRVRTVERDGKIVSARYGKIKGGLQLAPSNSKTCKVNLTYYLNPTSLDRNMEWDTKRNLLEGLSYEETPRWP